MASIYDIKPQFQNLLRPFVNWLAKIGITPNQVTIGAMVLSIITGILLILFHESSYILLVIPVVMFVRMALNAIDGMLAKEHQMTTRLGNILNELGDVISDAFLFLPFAILPEFSASLIIVIVIFSIISEMAGILGEVIGASRRYDGPMGKSDRAFVFGLLAILTAFNLIPRLVVTIILALTLLLIVLNIFIRIHRALKEEEEHAV
ncbi:MAG TPA: CDP-alcohol phosphatidyltransferase family protein [Pseudogracilibacillus sp.]|nr:CDP-alcohol phosphatidyltransferase family protein [Pseudogracilibacillus sp.]